MAPRGGDDALRLLAPCEAARADPLPATARTCTDKLFLLLIVATWSAMVALGLVAMGYISSEYIDAGNPSLLVHGVDYEGNICGVDEAVQSLPKRVFPNLYGDNPDSQGTYAPVLLAVCVSACPSKQDTIYDPYGAYGTWVAPQDSSDFLNNCVYVGDSSGSTSATTILSDFAHTAGLIGLLGFLLAVALSLLFLCVVRVPLLLRFVVWMCAAVIQLLLSGGALFFLSQANQHNGGYSRLCHCSTEVALLKVVGGLLTCCALLWACVLAFWRRQIALAISLVREAAAALTSMPLIGFMPILQTGVFAAFTALWMLFCVYLVSSGRVDTHVDETTGFSYKSIHYDDNAQKAILFMLFAWLWSVGYIEAVGQIACAHAVTTWYFAPLRAAITSAQVVRSVGTAVAYHSGSAAMGALLITALRGLRFYAEAVRRLDRPTASAPARWLVWWSRCVLACFERCVKFLTKHAYIQVALRGSAFLPAAAAAFSLLLANLSRLAAVSVVGDFVVLVGKLSISLTCAATGYAYMQRFLADELNGFVLPTVFVFFVAFVTSTMFLSVLSATSDALLQACVMDEKRVVLDAREAQGSNGRHEDFKGLYDLVQSDDWKEFNDEDEDPVVTIDLRERCDEEMVRVVDEDPAPWAKPPLPPQQAQAAPAAPAVVYIPSPLAVSMGNSHSRYARPAALSPAAEAGTRRKCSPLDP